MKDQKFRVRLSPSLSRQQDRFHISESGFWAIPKRVMADPKLSHTAKLVYGVLYTRKNADNLSFPSHKYIATALGYSNRHVRRLIEELEESEWIYKERRGIKKTNVYLLD